MARKPRNCRAELVRADGSVEPIAPANGRDFKLDELRKLVGDGWIQVVPLTRGRVLVCDEEGKLKGLPINAEATKRWAEVYGRTDIIVGDVCFVAREQIR